VEKWLVNVVMVMYESAEALVRTPEGDSRPFDCELHLTFRQGMPEEDLVGLC